VSAPLPIGDILAGRRRHVTSIAYGQGDHSTADRVPCDPARRLERTDPQITARIDAALSVPLEDADTRILGLIAEQAIPICGEDAPTLHAKLEWLLDNDLRETAAPGAWGRCTIYRLHTRQFGATVRVLGHWRAITSGRTIGWVARDAERAIRRCAMRAAPTLDQTPAGPSGTSPRVESSRRRIAAIVAVVVIVGAALLAIAYAVGWFGTGDTQAPIVGPDDTASDLPDDTAPDLPDDVTPDNSDVVPDVTDDVSPDRPDAAAATPRYREEPPTNWDVTGVAAGDVLNVRAGPGITFSVTGTLAANTVKLESTGRIADVGDQLWRELLVPGDASGWVNAAYLTGHQPVPAPKPPAPSPDPAPAPLPASLRGAEWDHVPTTQKVVALTFDAGANADGVPSILSTLEATNTPATFFLTGRWTDNNPELARRIAARYPVGNHSITHPYFTALTDAQLRDELLGAEATITEVTGNSTRPLFRFPYGDRDARTVRLVNEAGYGSFRWTVDTLGWKGTSGGMTTSVVVDRVMDTARPGQIVLLHVGSHPTDRSTLDADALPEIIERLQAQGYRFITLTEALTIAGD
jgi:peptidoglycan/xylan/chitin deacetylase (PgdA/CDA1 family)